MPQSSITIVALRTALTPGQREIQVLPAGQFRARDGRPTDVPAWRTDAEIAKRLIERFEARKTPVVIDYEHQTLNAEKNGQPAPASGWFVALRWSDQDGLLATVDWTDRAAAYIEAKEYKFFSPQFAYDKTGAVTELRVSALTNDPGLDDLRAVALRTSLSDQEQHVNETLKKLLAALGLPDTTAEADALAGVAALKTRAETATADLAARDQQIAVLKTASPDPAKFVPVETMNALRDEVVALKVRLDSDEAAAVIDEAIKAGKLLPSQTEWAKDLAKTNIAALKAYVCSAPTLVPQQRQTSGAPVGGADGKTLDADQLAVCKTLGITAEAFIAAGKAGAA